MRRATAAAIVATIAVAGVLLTSIFNTPAAVTAALFISAVAAMTATLFYGYFIFSHVDHAPLLLCRRNFLRYIVLHIVPVSYLALQWVIGASLIVDTIYLAPIVLFFYTGRRAWADLYTVFRRKMYRIYYFGNTAFMRLSPLWLLVALLIDDSIAMQAFRRSMFGYFSIHFLITGVTIVIIKKDIIALNANK